MKKILDTIVFGGYTAQDVLIVVEIAIAFLIFFRILMRVFKKEESSKYSQFVDCLNAVGTEKLARSQGVVLNVTNL
jgi:hypothetical protein